MTIRDYLRRISSEDMDEVRQYLHRIQPFHVLPSNTKEFDGQFCDDGELVFSEITLFINNDHIEDMYCSCGANGLCAHLAAMMLDIEEQHTIGKPAPPNIEAPKLPL